MTRVVALQQLQKERGWIAGIRAGDPAAFEESFRAYHPELCDFVNRLVRSPEVAEDVVHDVFAKLWAEREQFEVRDSLKSFLYTAVRNRAISHLRHQRVDRRWRERTLEAKAGSGDATLPSVPEPERRLENDELTAAIERVLGHLPERCRMVFTLRCQRHMTYAEVAEVMGVSVKSVEVYMSKVLAALRQGYDELSPYL